MQAWIPFYETGLKFRKFLFICTTVCHYYTTGHILPGKFAQAVHIVPSNTMQAR